MSLVIMYCHLRAHLEEANLRLREEMSNGMLFFQKKSNVSECVFLLRFTVFLTVEPSVSVLQPSSVQISRKSSVLSLEMKSRGWRGTSKEISEMIRF